MNDNTFSRFVNLSRRNTVPSISAVVRDRQLAANIGTSGKRLAVLALSGDELTRISVAKNPSTPARSIELLMKDASWRVRLSVVENELTDDMLERMLKVEQVTIILMAIEQKLNNTNEDRC